MFRQPRPAYALSQTLLWITLGVYLLGRLSQLLAPVLPALLIVLLHVVPPAAFAAIHGSRLYRVRGFLIFAVFCLGVGTVFESLSLRTGFPFGHYEFTSVMGPKIFGLPVLLVLAYLGIGYTSWVLAALILGRAGKPGTVTLLFAQPVLSACIMTAWDLAMDPDWGTLDRAWIWGDGGAWFGVPLSNYFGWLLTTWGFYQAFAFWLRRRPAAQAPQPRAFWRSAVLLYALCAAGNLLIPLQPMAPPVVADPSGRLWQTSDILRACVLCSVFLMGSFAVLAWLRIPSSDGEDGR